MNVKGQHCKARLGPTFVYQPANVSNEKLHDAIIFKISRCLKSKRWIEIGRELGIPYADLEQIKANHKENWIECAYQTLRLWKERRPDCNLQNLFTALGSMQWIAPIQEITKHVKRYLMRSQNKSENVPMNKWSNLNERMMLCIVSKMTLKSYLKCRQISKHWMKSAPEFYTFWMEENCDNWTESSFINAMKNGVNSKEICWKSSEEWKRSTVPTLINEIDALDKINCITISNDGKLLAVGSDNNIRIYDSMDLKLQFSRDGKFFSRKMHFNGKDSCILVEDGYRLSAVKIEEKQPGMHFVNCIPEIERPWWADNIFLSGMHDRKEDKTTFYLNEIAEKGNIQYPILSVKGDFYKAGIVQMDSCNVLVSKSDKTKLVFKTISKIGLNKHKSEKQLETPDHEVDCQGEIKGFIDVPDGNTKKLYVLAKMTDKGFCFFIIDLESFQLKSSSLLVPRKFNPCGNLASNAKYMASGSHSKCAYIWDLKSGLCIAQLKHEGYVLCAIHPIDPQLVITAGLDGKKIKLWQLNTDKIA